MINTDLVDSLQPNVPRASVETHKVLALLPWNAPFRWLALGWRDIAAHPFASLFYSSPFWFMALVLDAIFLFEAEYAMMAVSICLLLGPFVAMGLYDTSRLREKGLPLDFMASLTCWKKHLRSMGMLAGVLLVLELIWGRASLLVTALFFDAVMPSDFDVIGAAFNASNWEFLLAFTTVAVTFAALAFSLAVVSAPMILDRDTDAIKAAMASMQVVGKNTGVMLLWAALITLLVGVSVLLPMAVGLAVVGPLLGHASWHAYRDSVRWA
jgi:uncharacterized membrane protein